MFCCIYAIDKDNSDYQALVAFASRFSPLVEETGGDSVVLDLEGTELLNGPFTDFPGRITRLAEREGMAVRAAVAANPDAAFHAAHGLPESVFIEPGKEAEYLGDLPVENISHLLADITVERLGEIVGTLNSWGISTFGPLAALPTTGISERLGPEGVRIQQLAKGKTRRSIIVKSTGAVFSLSERLEHPVSSRETLLLVLAGYLEKLTAYLKAHHLAAAGFELETKLADGSTYARKIQFPSPIKEYRTLKKILELEIEGFSPSSPVIWVRLELNPGKTRMIQSGLFTPDTPEPEKTELVLARIGKIVGQGKIGSPEVENSHRPDPVRIKRFDTGSVFRKNRHMDQSPSARKQPATRKLRPPLAVMVWMGENRPIRVQTTDSGIRKGVSGKVLVSAGPWLTSGEWWSKGKWEREEWDLQLSDGTICRVYHDLQSNRWYLDAIYD